MHPGRVDADMVQQRGPGPVSFRSGSPAGTKRSSPHQMSHRGQSISPETGPRASSARISVPMPPPVSTSEADPLAATAPAIRPASWAATALASCSASGYTCTCGALTASRPGPGRAVVAARASP